MAWQFRQWMDHLPLWVLGLMAAVYVGAKIVLVMRGEKKM